VCFKVFLKAVACEMEHSWCNNWFQACGPANEDSCFLSFVDIDLLSQDTEISVSGIGLCGLTQHSSTITGY